MPGQVFKLSRGGLPDIISLMQIYLPLLPRLCRGPRSGQ